MARYEFTKESHTVDMMGPIHSDIFFQDRLMLNGVNLRIKLNRAKNVHDIMSSHIHCTHLNLQNKKNFQEKKLISTLYFNFFLCEVVSA